MMETITSRTNQLIKKAVQLKSRKFRDRYGLFLMEGIRSAEEAVASGRRGTIFVTEEALSRDRVAALVEKGEDRWRFCTVPETLMKDMTGTEHSQEVLAMIEKSAPPSLPEGRLTGRALLLDGIQDPGNMGTILRTAAASGVKAVFLTKGSTDPYGEKAVRSSMGAILRLPVYEGLLPSNVAALRKRCGLPLIGTALEGAKPYRKAPFFREGIFVFGNEGNGITTEILSLCDEKIYIPLAGGVESLNVTAAAAVILFYYAEPLT